jgi:hypothetical protein
MATADYPLHYILSPGNDVDGAMFSHYSTHNGTNWALIHQDYGIEEAIRILRNEGDVDCSYFWEKLQKAERWKARGSRKVRRPSLAATVDTLRSFAQGCLAQGFKMGDGPDRESYPTLLIAKVGPYTLSSEGTRFVMRGGHYGAHSLDIGCTDAERLAAHWEGYQEVSNSKS